ncbi:acyl carrier protein [Streptomyces varsoviensis]|uniref:acyl carrier protein n=1 Tax=Streptomyces varsoviensis TaxID=67373 RepID=UPI0033F7E615
MSTSAVENQADGRSTEDLRAWLTQCVALHVQLTPEQIKPDVPLTDYGLDSIYALTVASEIEDHLGIDLDPTVMWNHPTIDDLVGFLTEPDQTA